VITGLSRSQKVLPVWTIARSGQGISGSTLMTGLTCHSYRNVLHPMLEKDQTDYLNADWNESRRNYKSLKWRCQNTRLTHQRIDPLTKSGVEMFNHVFCILPDMSFHIHVTIHSPTRMLGVTVGIFPAFLAQK
jgi:hypothetical protein